ncbi:MAG: radical SAM protein [Deltaproteobacteria bacterium]|nr:radical SAM protein [Deltaproteobacteria bacterium]
MSVMQNLVELAATQGVPAHATIELTAKCHLACAHCYVSHDRQTKLSLACIVSLLADLKAAGGLFVTFTGGEIALRPDLYEIVAEARRGRFAVRLFTTGTLWGTSEWQRVADLGVESVQVSVYADGPKIHDQVTGRRGSFSKTLATIHGLVDRGVTVVIGCPILSTNARHIHKVAALADRLGVGLRIDPLITGSDCGGPAPNAAAASPELLAVVYGHPRFRRAGPETELPTESRGAAARPCSVGDASVFVRSSGDVIPCSQWPTVAGNVLLQPLTEIFHRSPVFRACRALTKDTLCSGAGCVHAQTCRPCAGMNLQERGSLALPSLTVCRATFARRASHSRRPRPAQISPRT